MNFSKIKNNKIKLLITFAAIGTKLFGASIDHVQNYSAEYNANMAQQAAINPGTSAYYNPAGIMELRDGTYATGGAQLAFGKEMMSYKTKHDGKDHDYSAKLFAPIPDLAIIKKSSDKAVFWTFGAIGGGGDLKYKDGVAGITVLEDALSATSPIGTYLKPYGKGVVYGKDAKEKGSWAQGKNMYAQTTLGTAWKINDKLSMSVGGRLVYGWRVLKANLDADVNLSLRTKDGKTVLNDMGTKNLKAAINSKRTAWGLGGQIGLNYRPNDVWNFALRYDTKVKLDFEANTKSSASLGGLSFEMFFPQYADGAKYRRDLPAILALGATQQVNEKLKMFYGMNYYFNESAKIDKDVAYHNPTNGKIETGLEYKDGFELSLGTEYQINPKWALLGGINYAKTGAPKESFNDVEFAIDSILVGAGIKYTPDTDTQIVVSTSHYFYQDENGNFDTKYKGTNAQNYDKNISSIGISYTKKL